MTPLDRLENESVFILREAYAQVPRLAALWSLGKDSGVMLWLIRKAFFGHVPFPVVHIDTGKIFPEMVAFRKRYAAEWGLRLEIGDCPPIGEIDPALPPATRAAARKTAALKALVGTKEYGGLIAGIRRDEEGTRAKERVFSLRDEGGAWDLHDQKPEFWDQFNTGFPPGTHVRVHPLLHWTEIDIWRYIGRENIPVLDLYFAKNGKRYRSLGDAGFTFPVESEAADVAQIVAELERTRVAERSGRAMDREAEDSFERLRAGGYP